MPRDDYDLCLGCGSVKANDELTCFPCCGLELCRDCQPYHLDTCPVTDPDE